MKFVEENSDEVNLQELGDRLARYRLNRNLTQGALAQEAGVSLRTLIRLEHGESTHLTNLMRVLRALGLLANLETLVPAPVDSPVQQLKMRGKSRQRASSPEDSSDDSSDERQPWSWGDNQ